MRHKEQAASGGGRSPEPDAGTRTRKNWTAQRKTEVVMRLLRGEGLEELLRECKVSAADISQWRDDFIFAGKTAMKSRKHDPLNDKLSAAERKIGDLTMRLEVAKELLKKSVRKGGRSETVAC